MTTPLTITINQIEYIRKDSITTPAGPPTPHRIVVADRGWVFVGATEQHDDGSLTITNAKCIRVWGTDESKPGLGYLAQHGPTSKTKLDASGTVRVPTHAVVFTLDTDAPLWQ
jgi:hypothetical protein